MTLTELKVQLAKARDALGAMPPAIPPLYSELGEDTVKLLVAYSAVASRVHELEAEIKRRTGQPPEGPPPRAA